MYKRCEHVVYTAIRIRGIRTTATDNANCRQGRRTRASRSMEMRVAQHNARQANGKCRLADNLGRCHGVHLLLQLSEAERHCNSV